MKALIPIIIGLLVVGCGKKDDGNTDDGKSTKAKPIKELTAEEKKLIGEYERKSIDGVTYKFVFLENGIVEEYKDDKKGQERRDKPLTWGINKNGELYIIWEYPSVWIYSINKDTSITYIAHRMLGVRKDWAKEEQETFKKIK